MSVSAVSKVNINYPLASFQKKDIPTKHHCDVYRAVYTKPNSQNIISFYCPNISFGKKSCDEFVSSEQSYVEFLKSTDDTPEKVNDFLLNTLRDEESRDKFISEITENPEKSKEITSVLVEKLGGKDNFLKWYLHEDGYVKSYEGFLEKKYDNAESIEELLKFQPNWGYWALERKQCALDGKSLLCDELMRDQAINFSFGELPLEIKSRADFIEIVYNLKNSKFGDKSIFINTSYPNYSYFYASQLEGGDRSAKNIYLLTDMESDKKYIVKTDRFYPEDNLKGDTNPYYSRLAKELKLIRGDSVYLDACLDYYLQLNGCDDNAKLIYYDFASDVAIYEYIDCEEINKEKKHSLAEPIEANKLFPKINSLGVFLNDIGLSFNSYIDKSGKYKTVDVGHAEYLDVLKPGAQLLTVETSNLCGFSIKNVLSSLNTDMLDNLTADKKNVSRGSIINFNRISNEFNSTDYIYEDPKYTNVDFDRFMLYKDYKKSDLKERITDSIVEDGEYSRSVYLLRKQLIDFYKTNINARLAGYGSNDPKIISNIVNAINREEKLIDEIVSHNPDVVGDCYED